LRSAARSPTAAAKDKNAIEVASADKPLSALQTLKAAVEGGDPFGVEFAD